MCLSVYDAAGQFAEPCLPCRKRFFEERAHGMQVVFEGGKRNVLAVAVLVFARYSKLARLVADIRVKPAITAAVSHD